MRPTKNNFFTERANPCSSKIFSGLREKNLPAPGKNPGTAQLRARYAQLAECGGRRILKRIRIHVHRPDISYLKNIPHSPIAFASVSGTPREGERKCVCVPRLGVTECVVEMFADNLGELISLSPSHASCGDKAMIAEASAEAFRNWKQGYQPGYFTPDRVPPTHPGAARHPSS